MNEGEAVQLLARWIRELQWELQVAQRHNSALEGRCHRLEQAVRRDALARRHWIRNGHPEKV